MGIFSNKAEWNEIVCVWDKASAYDLWYSRYDGKENFDDFKPFGGWIKPQMKQYMQLGNTRQCNTDLGRNFY